MIFFEKKYRNHILRGITDINEIPIQQMPINNSKNI